jgi:hypothetical protein
MNLLLSFFLHSAILSSWTHQSTRRHAYTCDVGCRMLQLSQLCGDGSCYSLLRGLPSECVPWCFSACVSLVRAMPAYKFGPIGFVRRSLVFCDFTYLCNLSFLLFTCYLILQSTNRSRYSSSMRAGVFAGRPAGTKLKPPTVFFWSPLHASVRSPEACSALAAPQAPCCCRQQPLLSFNLYLCVPWA